MQCLRWAVLVAKRGDLDKNPRFVVGRHGAGRDFPGKVDSEAGTGCSGHFVMVKMLFQEILSLRIHLYTIPV